MVVSGLVAGALIRKMGPRIPLIVGAAAVAASFTILDLGHSEGWQIIVSGLLTGVGIGMALAATRPTPLLKTFRQHRQARQSAPIPS
ncbi:hypothetical protein [Pseudarthrobacter sp. PS3-L1]|uniref:hypothetical protein n=1 Tax=Pseudarthrobacter sp. PS3-L1 TaxID=3046207 RepID=UPI0024B9103F|nr:hypothetical protein [Pseudarthrobacter sp. PS3-L1]MDJ0322079.1 hypothetical protein [Pseudarthrobacter sp. PS3-L1]